MAEYIDRKRINLNGFFDAGDYSQAMRCINNMPTADVVERSKINKAIDEMNSIELGLVMDCDDMRDYCVEILKRNIGE